MRDRVEKKKINMDTGKEGESRAKAVGKAG